MRLKFLLKCDHFGQVSFGNCSILDPLEMLVDYFKHEATDFRWWIKWHLISTNG